MALNPYFDLLAGGPFDDWGYQVYDPLPPFQPFHLGGPFASTFDFTGTPAIDDLFAVCHSIAHPAQHYDPLQVDLTNQDGAGAPIAGPSAADNTLDAIADLSAESEAPVAAEQPSIAAETDLSHRPAKRRKVARRATQPRNGAHAVSGENGEPDEGSSSSTTSLARGSLSRWAVLGSRWVEGELVRGSQKRYCTLCDEHVVNDNKSKNRHVLSRRHQTQLPKDQRAPHLRCEKCGATFSGNRPDALKRHQTNPRACGRRAGSQKKD